MPKPPRWISTRIACVCALLLALVPTSTRAADQPKPIDTGLDSLAAATLDRALRYIEIRPAELGFDKLYADDDTFRLSIVEKILGQPMMLPQWQSLTLQRLRDCADHPGRLAGLLGELEEAPAGGAGLDTIAWPGAVPGTNAAGSSVRIPPQQAVDAFIAGCRTAEVSLNEVFARWSPENRERVLMLAPVFWGDWEDPSEKTEKGALHREVGATVDTTLKLTDDPILDAATLMQRPALTRAAGEYLTALMRLVRDLDLGAAGASSPPAETLTLDGVTGPVRAVYQTPWGLLVIGGSGSNAYSAEACRKIAFLLDPGGDDVYRGRIASAVGGLLRPFGAVVDGAGNDLYEAEGRSFCLGGAVLGVAALIDLSGNDVYRGGDGTLGAGFFGAGFLYDGTGVDIFEGGNLCQGSGAFGMGALISQASSTPPPQAEPEADRSYTLGFVKKPGTGAVPVRYDENDTYIAARQSQGFASTFGIGVLYDVTGNDVYRAGGHSLHRPLLPNDFQALSQGFSIGFRPRAGGGIGILLDEQGNDFYDAEVYAQGASYWYSVGLLCDVAGNDRYLATQYAQGAGIHLSVGSLWDRAGDDHYVCKLGVTQGTAHDLGVGFLLEESGNDFYVVSDGQGMSITNSAGIFVDAQGNDVYATPGVGQGCLTWARGFCGSGVFLDLEGKDSYPAGGPSANAAVWSPDLYAIGIDLDRDIVLPNEAVPEPVLTAADSARAVPELFETACIWDVGSARETVARARAALLTRPREAMEFALRERLDSQDGLVYRILLDVAKAQPDSFSARILPRLKDPDQFVQRNVISLLGEMKRTEARPPMEAMLKDRTQERHWVRLIQALGNIGDGRAAPSLRPFLRDAKERRRIYSCVALAALKDTVSVPAMVGLLSDSLLTVRSAASNALAGFATAAVPALAEDQASMTAVGLRTLGQIGDAIPDSANAARLTARAAVRRALMAVLDRAPTEAGSPERAAAVRALLRLRDPETAAFVRLHMRDEYDPLVKRTYEIGLEEIARLEKAGKVR
jgi:hypothetical protein